MQTKIDIVLLVLLLMLIVAGVLAIYTASATRIGEDLHVRGQYLRQLIWIALSLAAMVMLVRIPYRILEIFFMPMYVMTLLLLGLVLLFPAIGGAHRWLLLGPLRLQPSELAKLVTVLAAAKLLSKPHLKHGQMLLRAVLVCGLPAILVAIEPDLGTALVFGAVFLAVLLASGFPMLYVFLLVSPLISVLTVLSWPLFVAWMLILVLILYRNKLTVPIISIIGVVNVFVFLVTPVLWRNLKPYQQNRILTFLDPGRDPLGAGYQTLQARIAIGSGGMTGKGFLLGTQKNLEFLPERHTDFIFSVVGEEFGFIGTMLLLTLFVLLLLRILRVIGQLQQRQHRIIATGVFAYLAFQVLVNVSMNLGLMPITGLPLPFISYGGSSLMVNTLGVAMILKVFQEKSFAK
ncbi:MAG: rod shape-determining protein RodA [Candidatus Cloacimonetes bacterium]|nr:rod shape-determining protein RodA [Candidatus Cloacimonadota bacterium]